MAVVQRYKPPSTANRLSRSSVASVAPLGAMTRILCTMRRDAVNQRMGRLDRRRGGERPLDI